MYKGSVDYLLTEDKKIHQKAKELGIENKVFTIEQFIEKVNREYPDLADYKVLSVYKSFFGDIKSSDEFFDSFKEDYQDFVVCIENLMNQFIFLLRMLVKL